MWQWAWTIKDDYLQCTNLIAKEEDLLVYGESKTDNEQNAEKRVFKLGNDSVKERTLYDHVGMKSCISSKDKSKGLEKKGEGRITLNASSGLDISKNGLNIMHFMKIFWSVVESSLLFGCELWILSYRDCENLLTFKRYAGRHI